MSNSSRHFPVHLTVRCFKRRSSDHICGLVLSPRPSQHLLSQRWHNLGGTSEVVQRDCYSAFLAKNVTVDLGFCQHQHNSSRLIPSERIAGQRGLVYGLGQMQVAEMRELGTPRCAGRSYIGLYPFGFCDCQRQASLHMSSKPRVAFQPSSSIARPGSAKHVAISPARRSTNL